MSQYDISVIVPVYNAGAYLCQCIDSILAQTKKEIELVIVDDGSTDGSAAIIDEYAGKNDNIVAIHQKNGGVIKARVTGLKNTTADYIGWVDADDFIKPDMFEKLYERAVSTGADYVYCDYEFYPGKVATKEKWFKPYEGHVDWMYIERNTQAWNTLTSRKLFDEIDMVNMYKKYGEYVWISVLLNARKTSVLEEKLYYYRVGNNTLSGGSYIGKTPKFYHQVVVTRSLCKLAEGTGYEESLRGYFHYRRVYTSIQLAIVAAVNEDRKMYAYARRELKRLKYLRNPLTKTILDYNHGKLKSAVMRYGIPMSYTVARLIVKQVF